MTEPTTLVSPTTDLVFLKLGGSLITDKTRPRAVRANVLARLAAEIAEAREQNPALRLVIGHGSGSFGHIPAKKYGTRQGVQTIEQWLGFVEVWRQANALNRLVMDAFSAVAIPPVEPVETTRDNPVSIADAPTQPVGGPGLPALAFSPLAAITSQDSRVAAWELAPLQAALDHELIPVIQGDVIFDTARGGTILSTEDLFVYLASVLHPTRILLAGIEPGVWADFPARTQIIPLITPANVSQVAPALSGSAATDVTGGMASKVHEMLSLVQSAPALEVLIFSAEQPDALREALLGVQAGTLIRYN